MAQCPASIPQPVMDSAQPGFNERSLHKSVYDNIYMARMCKMLYSLEKNNKKKP